jgi:MFS family permease
MALVWIAAPAVAEIVPAFTRPVWTTLLHVLGRIGQVIGPIYAGAFVKANVTGWRWAFYINAILSGIGTVAFAAVYRPSSRIKALGLSKRKAAKSVDYIGMILFIGGITSLLHGLSLTYYICFGCDSKAI